jgi:hypothetical protein
MSPAFLVLWHSLPAVISGAIPEPSSATTAPARTGVRNVEAITWCTNEDEECLLTIEEMEEVIDCQLGALLAIGA